MNEKEKEKPIAKYTIEYATKYKVCQYCGEPVVFHEGDGYYEGIVYAHRTCYGLPALRKVILACEFYLEEGQVINGFKLQTFTRSEDGLSENWDLRSHGNWSRGRRFKGCPKVIQIKDISIGLTVAHLMTREEMMDLIQKHLHTIVELKSICDPGYIDASHFLKALGFKEPETIDTEGMDKLKPTIQIPFTGMGENPAEISGCGGGDPARETGNTGT